MFVHNVSEVAKVTQLQWVRFPTPTIYNNEIIQYCEQCTNIPKSLLYETYK